MKKVFITLSAVVAVSVCGLIACNSASTPSERTEGIVATSPDSVLVAGLSSQEKQIERGRYLVTIMSCNDCHSPKVMTPMGPVPDSTRLLSGHPASMPVPAPDPKLGKDWILFNQNLTAFVGPWGTTYAANLTSSETGIGNWTEEQFFRALREGKYKGQPNGRPLLPPMPWQMIGKASDEDLRAIFTYLKSTQAVDNVVPAPAPPVAAK